MSRWKKVQMCKIDLDTAGCGYIMGVTRDDSVEILTGEAEEENLCDRSVLCIEVGGAGRTRESNFDHHEVGGPIESATLQAFKAKHNNGFAHGGDLRSLEFERHVKALCEYIDAIDTVGPKALRRRQAELHFPFLSDAFAGLLLTEGDPIKQFYKGIELLRDIVISEQDPAGTIEDSTRTRQPSRKTIESSERQSKEPAGL